MSELIRLIKDNYPLKDIQTAYYKEPFPDVKTVIQNLTTRKWEVAEWIYHQLVVDGRFDFTEALKIALKNNNTTLLNSLYWYAQENNMDLHIDNDTIDNMKTVEILDWCKKHILPEDYCVHLTILNSDSDILTWWCSSGFTIVLNEEQIKACDVDITVEKIKSLHEASVAIPKVLIVRALCRLARRDYIDNDLLNWFYDEYQEIIVHNMMIQHHSEYGNMYFIADYCRGHSYDLLRFLHSKGVAFSYSHLLINNLKHIDEAKFWDESFLELKHTPAGLINCLNANIALAHRWFKNDLSYNKSYKIDYLVQCNNINAIQFLLDKGIVPVCTPHMYLSYGQIWSEHGLRKMKNTMEFLLNKGIEFTYKQEFIDQCIAHFAVDILKILYELTPFTSKRESFGSKFNKGLAHNIVPFLEWWLSQGLEIHFTDNFVSIIRGNSEAVAVLDKYRILIPGE